MTLNLRLDKLRRMIHQKNIDGVIAYKPENRRYLSGFTGTAGYVVVTIDKAFFITDFRYVEQARRECVEYEIIEHNDRRSVYSILNDLNLKTLGFEDDFVTYSQYKEFLENLTKTQFIPLDGTMNHLRKIKDADEIDNIEKAAIITDEAFGYICEYIKPGVSEKEIALELEMYMKRKGASALSFEIIVASGIRSSLPHGRASNKLIEKGDFITMDFGCIFNGYCSDMTRTIVVGKANEKQKEIYGIVLEAQIQALDAIRPGAAGIDVDKIARKVISTKGYGKNFGHGLGHGVGLEIHEAPRLSPTSKDILEAGMVVTDEPGIYIPDFGGVRIEDLVVVTQTGNRVLSKSPKELIEL
ncbi:Xaa-Pro peptidase family protein [Clostridiaceae bacterium 35-E11]